VQKSFIADLVTLSRLVMAGLIWIRPSDPIWILAWMAAAGVSDVLDGWLARGRTRRTWGEWLDPLCDKVFVASLIVLLVMTYSVEFWIWILIGARELAQLLFLPLLPWAKGFDFRSTWIGKAATVAQFLTLTCVMFAVEWVIPLAALTAAIGLISVAQYFMRHLRSRKV
jgi:cardiolipin synthase